MMRSVLDSDRPLSTPTQYMMMRCHDKEWNDFLINVANDEVDNLKWNEVREKNILGFRAYSTSDSFVKKDHCYKRSENCRKFLFKRL